MIRVYPANQHLRNEFFGFRQGCFGQPSRFRPVQGRGALVSGFTSRHPSPGEKISVFRDMPMLKAYRHTATIYLGGLGILA